MLYYQQILFKRNFFLLWVGQIISQFGDKLTQIALVGLVSKFYNSSFAIATSYSLTIIPVILFSPFCGVYVDRWDKKTTMYVVDFLRAILIFLGTALFISFSNPAIMYLVIFLSFCFGRFFIPAKLAFLPQVVEQKYIFLANSLISITATTAAILGIGIGGLLVEKYGAEFAFFLDGITFFVSGLAIFLIRQQDSQNVVSFDKDNNIFNDQNEYKKRNLSVVFELKEGIRYIAKSVDTRYAIYALLLLFLCVGGIFPVFTKFIQNTLKSVTKDLGLVGVAIALGVFFGSLFYAKFATKISIKKAINFSLLFASIYIIFFCITLRNFPNWVFAVCLSFILGIIIAPIFVAVTTLVHSKTNEQFFGRIFSSLEFVSHLAFLLSMFLFAILADKFSPFTIMIIIGIIGSIFSAFLFSQSKDD